MKTKPLKENELRDCVGVELVWIVSTDSAPTKKIEPSEPKTETLHMEIFLTPEGFCNCNTASKCPLAKIGSMTRCTKSELEAIGFKIKP